MTTNETANALDNFIDNYVPEGERAPLHRTIVLMMMKGLMPAYRPEFAQALSGPENYKKLKKTGDTYAPAQQLKKVGNTLTITKVFRPWITNPLIIGPREFHTLISGETQDIRAKLATIYMSRTINALLGLEAGQVAHL